LIWKTFKAMCGSVKRMHNGWKTYVVGIEADGAGIGCMKCGAGNPATGTGMIPGDGIPGINTGTGTGLPIMI
jgi:hypothetical protein